jgi:integrase
MSIHLTKDEKHYVSYVTAEGKRTTKTFGAGKENRRRAEAFDRQWKANRKNKKPSEPIDPDGLYFDDLVRVWLQNAEVIGYSGVYIRNVRAFVNRWVIPIIAIKPVDELTYNDILEVLHGFSDKSQTTKNKYLEILRTLFNYGIKHGLTQNNPVVGCKSSRVDPKHFKLNVADLKRIIVNSSPHTAWAIEVAWNTGARVGKCELLILKWENVEWDSSAIWIWSTKIKKWRRVPLSAKFMAKLRKRKMVAKSSYIVEYQGKPISYMFRSFETACKRAQISYPCTPYDVRHLFVSELLRQGGDVASIAEIAGHSVQTLLKHYAHVLTGAKEQTVALLPDLDDDTSGENVIRMF